MADNGILDNVREYLGGIWGNPTVLWFIILFLLLFWGCGGFGACGAYKE